MSDIHVIYIYRYNIYIIICAVYINIYDEHVSLELQNRICTIIISYKIYILATDLVPLGIQPGDGITKNYQYIFKVFFFFFVQAISIIYLQIHFWVHEE